MIIDAHRHMWAIADRHRAVFEESPPPWLAKMPEPNFDWEQASREAVEEMDSAGVAQSVLFVADFAARLGDVPFSIAEENRFIAEASKRYPDRIIPYYGIDPRRPGAADSYERAIKEWGVKGIKLHPVVGYFPHDRICYPIYELCVAYGLPVIFHSGSSTLPRTYSRFTHPLEFDQVAGDFPRLTIIMGHAGKEWWADCVTIANGHPNMVLELSSWQAKLRDNPQEAVPAIGKMRDVLGVERLVWGSDFPALRREMSLKECVEVFQRLPSLGADYGIRFDESDVEAILGGNAARLLNLK